MSMLMKKILPVFAALMFCALLTINVSAETDTTDSGIFEEEKLYESVPEQVKELLQKLGIDKIDFDSVFNVGADDIIKLLGNLLTGTIESPLKATVRLIAIIILIAVCESFMPDGAKINSVINLAGVLFCVISIINPISTVIKFAVASVTVSEKFMLVLLPVLTAVVSASGNPTLALSFQSIAFAAAQIISAVATKAIVPIIGVILALDISSSLMPKFSLTGITEIIKKSVTFILSFSATLFVSFLGLKAGLANTADTLATKGIKLVISSAVPIVGGALSEAYSGVLGNIMLAKSTIGVFGLCLIALIVLPSCIQLVFWIFSLKLSAGIAEMFELKGIVSLLKSVSSSLVLLNVVIVFVAVLFIISISLILILKAG